MELRREEVVSMTDWPSWALKMLETADPLTAWLITTAYWMARGCDGHDDWREARRAWAEGPGELSK